MIQKCKTKKKNENNIKKNWKENMNWLKNEIKNIRMRKNCLWCKFIVSNLNGIKKKEIEWSELKDHRKEKLHF